MSVPAGQYLKFQGIDRQEIFNPKRAGKTLIQATPTRIQTRTYNAEGVGERITVDREDAHLFWQAQGLDLAPKTWLGRVQQRLLNLFRTPPQLLAKSTAPDFTSRLDQFITQPYERSKHARTLTATQAESPVHQFAATNEYQQFFFQDQETQSFVGYRVENGVAIAMGSPCGTADPEKALKAWLADIKQKHLRPFLLLADDTLVALTKKMGLKAIPIGAEAMVDVTKFSLQGKAKQTLRTAVNRMKKEGWQVRPYREEDWPKISKLNQEWLKIHGGKEIGFAMGKASPQYLKETRTVLMLDKEGNLLAYLNTVELPKINGRAVDLMRRSPQAPGGVMEALFVKEIEQAKTDGLQHFDLELSPLAKLDTLPNPDNSFMINVMKKMYDWSKFYDFQGLYKFKDKFATDWQPRYMLYQSAFHFPRLTWAMIKLNQVTKLLPWHRED